MLEKTLESPLDCKEIQPVHPKGDQSWVFIRWTDVEAEPPILWPPDVKCWLVWKDPDAEKDWGQEEKGTTEDGMVRWDHRLSGHEFEQTLGDNKGQGSLACCSPWGGKEVWYDWVSEQQQWVDYTCGQLGLRHIGDLWRVAQNMLQSCSTQNISINFHQALVEDCSQGFLTMWHIWAVWALTEKSLRQNIPGASKKAALGENEKKKWMLKVYRWD